MFLIANSVRGEGPDPVYEKRVLKMLEGALKCGERSIKTRQNIRESPKKQAPYSESAASALAFPVPVENDGDPPFYDKYRSYNYINKFIFIFIS